MNDQRLNHVFDVLSNERRRRAVRYMDREGGEVDVRDIARELAEAENPEGHGSMEYKTVYVGLKQTHFRRMDDMGFVDYDEPRMTVRPTDLDDLVRVLDATEGESLVGSVRRALA